MSLYADRMGTRIADAWNGWYHLNGSTYGTWLPVSSDGLSWIIGRMSQRRAWYYLRTGTCIRGAGVGVSSVNQCGCTMFKLFKRDRYNDFWKWFVANEQVLFESVDPTSPPIQELAARLRKVHETLTYETSAKPKDVRELTISADGLREGIEHVEALVDAAPPLPRWKIIRFRSRSRDIMGSSIEVGDVSLSTKDIEYELIPYENAKTKMPIIGITLYMKGCAEPPDKAYMTIGFIMLDTAIGEYDMAMKVGPIEFKPWDTKTDGEREPFEHLPDHFDMVFERITSGN